MRPHRIRLSAFGAYPGEVEVDLDTLAAGGLFLLHGPTGAGKTTLLDALCFALFGRVPGARGEKRLRSDHAGPDAVCEVEVELTVAGRRLRVTRSPAWERPKLRGDGTTAQKATARLEERRNGAWRVVSSRPDEVGRELGELLGMSAEQFWQVVLLPQGAFADFLRASAADRQALLERLFRSDRFRSAEDRLGERRKVLAARHDEAAGLARSLTARVADAAGVAEPDEPDLDWYEQVLAAAAAADVAAAAEVVGADAAVDRAAAALRAHEQLAERQRRRAATAATLAALEAQAPVVEALRARLEQARRGAPVVPLADAADRLAAGAAAAALQAQRLVAGLAGPAGPAGSAGVAGAGPRPGTGRAVDPATLRAVAEQERARLGRLEGLAERSALLAQAEARSGRAASELAQVDSALADVVAGRSDLPALRADAASAVTAAQQAADALPAARLRVERESALAAEATRRAELAAAVAAAADADTAARESALAAGERLLAARTALLAGQAARLAAELVDGAPCAVCGSPVHPRPADASALVPEADLTAAEAASGAAQERRRQTAAALATATAELASLDRVLDGWRPELPAARAALAALEQTAATAPDAQAAVASFDELEAALASEQARLSARREALLAAGGEADEAAAAERAVLTAALDGAPDLDAAVAQTAARAVALEDAAAACTEAARARAAADEAAAVLATALAGAGFADLAALREVMAEQPDEQLLTDWDAELAVARAAAADPALAVPLVPPADPLGAGAEHDAAVRARQAATDAAAVAGDVHRRVRAHGPALGAAVADLAPLRAERDLVAGLAELTTGRNRLGMSLTSYVLAARLEEVAAAASTRLVEMTNGRYTLHHTDLRGDRRARGGLGLVVRDAWTGRDRDTGTLSGGETFLASLALALGLADTVTAEAGGAPIEALFVDEGFGTLDADALDDVMGVLDGLRAGGRLVGLVSHVADLRARIPAQLRVIKAPHGSTLEVVA